MKARQSFPRRERDMTKFSRVVHDATMMTPHQCRTSGLIYENPTSYVV